IRHRHTPMITTMHSDQNGSPPRVEVITSVQRRRRWPTAEKIRLVEETMQAGMSVSYVARRAGVAPSLLFNWRRRMLEGGLQAVQADEDVVGTSPVRELERRERELERLLGRKTMEVEILKEALDVARVKKPSLQLQSWNDRKDGSPDDSLRRASIRDQQGGASRRMVVRQRLGVHRQGHARHRNCLGPQALFHASPLARIQRHRGGIRQNLQTRLCSAVDLAGC